MVEFISQLYINRREQKLRGKENTTKYFFFIKIIFLTWNTAIVNTRVTITCNKFTTRETKKWAKANCPGETPAKTTTFVYKKITIFLAVYLFIYIGAERR